MKARRALARGTLLLLAACAVPPPLPDPPATHPASPAAVEAPERAPGQTLVMPVRTPPARTGSPGRGH